MRVDLLRHGETVGGARYRGRLDDALTPEGWRQMEEGIAGIDDWRRIVTSPLVRCAAFAEAAARRFDLPLTVDPRLREIDFGAWDGMTADQIVAVDRVALEKFWADPAANPPPGGEPMADFSCRVEEGFRDLLRYREPTLVVAHGGPIRVIRSLVEGVSMAEALMLRVPHGSLHRIEGDTLCVRF